ncbi:hypothetical protein NPIL_245881 [Nephila pilipes]|uniref:Uncharacterized protein n=1 Tax=Nephila pilipes TaxID=299642 RepID=A0A8X6J7U6_NEPPI|nr:hypothetical protein NPIL_245881 [Nephila pilipes]
MQCLNAIGRLENFIGRYFSSHCSMSPSSYRGENKQKRGKSKHVPSRGGKSKWTPRVLSRSQGKLPRMTTQDFRLIGAHLPCFYAGEKKICLLTIKILFWPSRGRSTTLNRESCFVRWNGVSCIVLEKSIRLLVI